MEQYPNLAALAALKGGVGKTAVSVQTAAALACDRPDLQIALIATDSNDSSHDILTHPQDRRPVDPSEELAEVTPASLPDDVRLNHLLDGPVTDAKVDAHLYRRPDLPNLSALFHRMGSLTELSIKLAFQDEFRARFDTVIETLCRTHDLVLLDTPADLEAPLVRDLLLKSGMILAASNLGTGGVRSAAVLAKLAVRSNLPLVGLVISPDDRSNNAVLAQGRADLHELAHRVGIPVHPIRKDAAVGKAERFAMPLVLFEREYGEEYRVDPGRALHDYRQLGSWIMGLVERPDELTAAVAQFRDAAATVRASARLRGANRHEQAAATEPAPAAVGERTYG